MERTFPKILFIAFVLFVIIGTHLAFAESTPPCSKDGTTYTCRNPLTSGDLPNLLISVRNQLFPFAITLVSIAILYIGFRMVIAVGSGNASELTKWRKFLVYALIGAAIVAASEPILTAIRTFLTGI